LKVALITDLHANREALEAVLEHAEAAGVQRHAFLGDYVGYGADPSWVVERVRSYVDGGAIAVLGNHDAGVVNGPAASMVPAARKVVAWTRGQLRADQLAFLSQLPLHRVAGDVLFVHANAFRPERWEYIGSRHEAVRSLLATDCRYTVCGHAHEPMLYHLSAAGKAGDFVPKPDVAIPVPPHRRWLVIPGSAGQPRDGDPAACYAVLDTEQQLLTYYRVPYDHEATSAKIVAAGLPIGLATRLADGT
jgi:diadenosine tetraphosphatase ApaH/serine/threonine PP2A family protein phosphatase